MDQRLGARGTRLPPSSSRSGKRGEEVTPRVGVGEVRPRHEGVAVLATRLRTSSRSPGAVSAKRSRPRPDLDGHGVAGEDRARWPEADTHSSSPSSGRRSERPSRAMQPRRERESKPTRVSRFPARRSVRFRPASSRRLAANSARLGQFDRALRSAGRAASRRAPTSSPHRFAASVSRPGPPTPPPSEPAPARLRGASRISVSISRLTPFAPGV